MNVSATPEHGRRDLLPTYERLFTSAVILNAAVDRLRVQRPAMLIDFASAPVEAWTGILRDNLIAKTVRLTNIIELSYRSKDPMAAEVVVSAVVQSYIEYIEKNHKNHSVEIERILDDRLGRVEEELEQRKRQLLILKRRIKDFGGGTEGVATVLPEVQRVQSLNETLIATRKERLRLQALLIAVRQAVRAGKDLRQYLLEIEPLVGNKLLSDTLGLNPQYGKALEDVEQKLITERADLQSLRAYYGEAHPEIDRRKRSIAMTEEHRLKYRDKVNHRLEEMQSRKLGPMLVDMLEEKLTNTMEHEKTLLNEYKSVESEALKLNDDLAELVMMERDVERLSDVHETLLDRIGNIDMTQGRSDVRVQIVKDPVALKKAVSPRKSVIGFVCLLIGFGGGCGLVYVLDLLDDRFRSPEEIKEQIGAPVLAMVRNLAPVAGTGIENLTVHTSPDAIESETFRTLRTTLAFAEGDTDCVAVTSSEPGDGKTTVLANLGVAFAQAGKKTLMIDADMRRPGLSKLLGLRGARGLSDVLRGQGDVAMECTQFIQASGIDHLDVISCGHKSFDPTELLSGPRTTDLIAWAQSVYEQVLIDCPPIMAASDAAIVGRLVDGMVVVVLPEKNHRRLVLRATENLLAMGVRLIGVVANRICSEQDGSFYGYGYGYGYSYDYGTSQESENEPDHDDQTNQVTPIGGLIPRRVA